MLNRLLDDVACYGWALLICHFIPTQWRLMQCREPRSLVLKVSHILPTNELLLLLILNQQASARAAKCSPLYSDMICITRGPHSCSHWIIATYSGLTQPEETLSDVIGASQHDLIFFISGNHQKQWRKPCTLAVPLNHHKRAGCTHFRARQRQSPSKVQYIKCILPFDHSEVVTDETWLDSESNMVVPLLSLVQLH